MQTPSTPQVRLQVVFSLLYGPFSHSRSPFESYTFGLAPSEPPSARQRGKRILKFEWMTISHRWCHEDDMQTWIGKYGGSVESSFKDFDGRHHKARANLYQAGLNRSVWLFRIFLHDLNGRRRLSVSNARAQQRLAWKFRNHIFPSSIEKVRM